MAAIHPERKSRQSASRSRGAPDEPKPQTDYGCPANGQKNAIKGVPSTITTTDSGAPSLA